jgi:hypothetical protein
MTCQPPQNASEARKATIASSHGLSVIDHLFSKVILFRARTDIELRTSRRFQIAASLITSIVGYSLIETPVIPLEVGVGWSGFAPPLHPLMVRPPPSATAFINMRTAADRWSGEFDPMQKSRLHRCLKPLSFRHVRYRKVPMQQPLDFGIVRNS